MEPLSALGIACNIMQVISFSYEAISVTRRVYDKGVVNEELVDKAADLEKLTSSVGNALKNSKQPSTAAEKEIVQIAKKCREASRELQKTMSELGSTSAKGNIVRSAGTSIKAMWKQSRIQKLEKNMMQWQQTLDSGILIHLW